MGQRRSPDREERRREYFRLVTVERLTSDRQRGLNHGASRNERVAEALCHMALIRDPSRRQRPISPAPVVSCVAAVRQFFRATGGHQAAHLVPGQILIDATLPWLFLAGPARRRLENVFAYVDPLQADYNKADSAAEQNGLTDAFAAACRHVLAGKGEAAGDIAAAYERVWVPGALAAFAAAEAQKRSKPAPPPLIRGVGTEYGMLLNFEERSEAFGDESLKATYEQLGILDYYKAAMEDPPRQLQPRAIGDILALPRA